MRSTRFFALGILVTSMLWGVPAGSSAVRCASGTKDRAQVDHVDVRTDCERVVVH
jgi:hypothetical protein